MSHIMKIYKTLLCNLNVFLKKDSHQESVSEMGVIPAHLKTLIERSYQVVRKDEHKMLEQEENIFDDDEDDTITVSG